MWIGYNIKEDDSVTTSSHTYSSPDHVIAVSSDHAGFELKQALIKRFEEWQASGEVDHTVLDLGPSNSDRVDYPDQAKLVVDQIQHGHATRGILVCGSGIGMSMAANRFMGIRCAVVCDPYMAELSRSHNNSNVLALGARVLGPDMAWRIVQTWLETPFEGGRHRQRVAKIDSITSQISNNKDL
jgi:ribose 5-phosphate isomerase B